VVERDQREQLHRELDRVFVDHPLVAESPAEVPYPLTGGVPILHRPRAEQRVVDDRRIVARPGRLECQAEDATDSESVGAAAQDRGLLVEPRRDGGRGSGRSGGDHACSGQTEDDRDQPATGPKP